MHGKIYSSALVGIDAVPVEVEVDISGSLPNFVIVGLPDASVKEASIRVKAAIKNSGLPFPETKVTVNLAPARIKKEGPAYDLPIAVAVLGAGGALGENWADNTHKLMFVGELALDGYTRPVTGILPTALMAAERGFTDLFVPEANADEAAAAEGIAVHPVRHLPELVCHLRGELPIPARSSDWLPSKTGRTETTLDFSMVKGQSQAKRALEIAAAGAHNILLSGPPGAGKTMLARAFVSILPEMTMAECLEVTKIHSVAGLTGAGGQLIIERPFRAPHHTASGVALIGGGTAPKPGEVSLAHRGVLFLDEFPEFPRFVLENLRQPLEDGTVTISRAQGTLRFPSKFILVAAQNPCPCGYATDPDRQCTCAPGRVVQYRKKISGPLLDRIDLQLEVPKVQFDEFFGEQSCEPSSAVRARVQAARERQLVRFSGSDCLTNAEMGHKQVRRNCGLQPDAEGLLRQAAIKMKFSARAFGRILKVSRTIADLAGAEFINANHLAEALQFRGVTP